MLNETNASSEKQEEGSSEFFVRIVEKLSWFFNNIIYFFDTCTYSMRDFYDTQCKETRVLVSSKVQHTHMASICEHDLYSRYNRVKFFYYNCIKYLK